MVNEKLACNQMCRWNDSSDGCIKPEGRTCPMSNTEPDASGWGQVQVANEKRLIDANALKNHVQAVSTHWLNDWSTIGVLAAVDKQPTVDAVEVVHARWENVQNGKGCCSNCHRLDSIDSLATHCRYCGAKMGGDWNE